MITFWLALAILAGVLLYLAGFYTGMWIQRHSYVDRPVPQLVETEKVVTVEVPRLIEVPIAKPKEGPSTPIMQGRRSVISDPAERAEAEKIGTLLGQLPEV